MLAKRIRGESGYSLVEVMASIIILTLAILPMAGMFEMGLKSATSGSNYDKARTLANLKVEEAKSLTFDSVKNNFPEAGTTYDGSGHYRSDWKTQTGPASADFTNLRYRVEKQYMEQPTASSVQFNTSTTETNLIRITVTIGWGGYDPGTDTYSNTYTTFGLVSA